MFSWNFSTYHFWILCIRYIKPLPNINIPVLYHLQLFVCYFFCTVLILSATKKKWYIHENISKYTFIYRPYNWGMVNWKSTLLLVGWQMILSISYKHTNQLFQSCSWVMILLFYTKKFQHFELKTTHRVGRYMVFFLFLVC